MDPILRFTCTDEGPLTGPKEMRTFPKNLHNIAEPPKLRLLMCGLVWDFSRCLVVKVKLHTVLSNKCEKEWAEP